MKFKKAISILLLSAIALSFASCGDEADAGETETVRKIVPSGQKDSQTEAYVTQPPPVVTEEVIPDTVAPVITTDDPALPPPVNPSQSTAEILAQYPNTVLAQTEDAGQEYIDRIVFLGDSTTYGLRFYEKLNGGKQTNQVWTPASGTLTLSLASTATIVYPETNEELTIADAVLRKQPDILVITLGVNGVSFMDEEYFKNEYRKIIQSVQTNSPNTKIICQSIFPVARSYGSLKSINNEKILAANSWIVAVADECGVKYIDTNSALCDEEGWLPEASHNGDGLHLNGETFNIELNNLRTHAWLN